MYTEERKHAIRQQIRKFGKVSVSSLSKEFNVSEVTIRRDLADMEKNGLLKRTFGGAISLELVVKEQPYSIKKEKNIEGKRHIAQLATKFISNDMVLFIDAGTTTAELIPYLRNYKNLFVFTVDLQIALNLSVLDEITVYMIGGEISHNSKSAKSIDTVMKINKLNFDLSFVGCDAFNEKGFETDTEARSQLKSSALNSSSVKLVLADNQKYNKHSLVNFTNLNKIDYFITDLIDPAFFHGLTSVEREKIIMGGFKND